MVDDCIFCKIASNQIPSHKVHEDANVLAFLDIHPLTKGHTLVIPKAHYVRFEDMPANEAATLMWTVHDIVQRVRDAVGAPATTIGINNGKEAGQEVPHVHVHVVPRTAGDGGGPVHGVFTKRADMNGDELRALAERIRRPTSAQH